MARVKVEGVSDVQKSLLEYQAKVKDAKQKAKLLSAGAQAVRKEAAKAPTPKSRKSHYYYPKKAGRVEIVPGNLRRSMRTYKTRQGDVEIGPKVLRRVAGLSEIGRTAKTASGFYAAALYGSASRFRREIMESALSRAEQKALAAIQKAYTKFHDEIIR
jgi:hypothetical protein